MQFRIHVSIPVSDLESSIGFYERLFGTSVTKREADYANFRLSEPPIHLALNVNPTAAAVHADRSHFGVELEDLQRLGAWTERLVTGGQAIKEEADTGCCYARGDKTWVADPDGHAWELWVRSAGEHDKRESDEGCCVPSATEVTKAEDAKASSCC